MVEVVLRRGRRRGRERMLTAAVGYAALGWPVCAGAHPGGGHTGRGCSCDRVGCPAPGAHPISAAWQLQATADSEAITRLWTERPDANVIFPTGRVFDVFDVPADSGAAALERLGGSEMTGGPVATCPPDRYLFFVATRGAPADEDEWWSCHLDSIPAGFTDTAGLRWHCRDSYVLAPPSLHGSGLAAQWVRPPSGRSLPDSLRVLDVLVNVCGAL